MKSQTRLLIIAIIFLLCSITLAHAQVEKADIRIDGLACPFCAYGLEKKLKQVEGVGNIRINVDKGIAALERKEGQSIEVEKIAPAVKDAGFTPREITVTVVGNLATVNNTSVLKVSGMDEEFILSENEQFESLRSALKDQKKQVRISGTIEHQTPEKHHAHPYTLTIEKFEVIG